MVDGVWDEPDDEPLLPGRRRISPELERERLRDVLGFPAPVESGESFDRHGRRVAAEEVAVEQADTEVVAPAPPARFDALVADDEVGRRLQQLTTRVEVVAGLVESLFDRIGARGSDNATLTSDELADIAAQIVRIVETRLDTQSERIERVIAELGSHQVEGSDQITVGQIVHIVESELKAHSNHLDDVVAQLAARPVEVVAEGVVTPPVDLSAIEEHLTAIGRAILELRTTLTDRESQAQEQRLQLQRFDQALIDASARMAELPDRQALRDLYQSLSQQFFQSQQSVRDGLVEVQETVSALPTQIAMQDPIARLDATILQQLDMRLAETSEGLAQKVDDQLSSRVQRFEALSQAMMTLVGDPVDSLAARLGDVVRAQSNPNVLQAIGELTQIQAQLASALASLRKDGLERDALLRNALEKLDRLAADERRPPPVDPPPSLFS